MCFCVHFPVSVLVSNCISVLVYNSVSKRLDLFATNAADPVHTHIVLDVALVCCCCCVRCCAYVVVVLLLLWLYSQMHQAVVVYTHTLTLTHTFTHTTHTLTCTCSHIHNLYPLRLLYVYILSCLSCLHLSPSSCV